MKITTDDLYNIGKGLIGIVIAVVAVIAWMDGRFITTLEAKDFVKTQRIDKIERMITFQELRTVWKDIEQEEQKFTNIRNQEKIKILYQEESRLKEQLDIK